jgi:hypothetical protein
LPKPGISAREEAGLGIRVGVVELAARHELDRLEIEVAVGAAMRRHLVSIPVAGGGSSVGRTSNVGAIREA